MDRELKNRLIQLASSYTIKLLYQYGNTPTPEHIKALKRIIVGFTFLLDNKNKKLAFPLFCGGGKSTCIRGFLRALHELNLDYGIVVSANQVQALCDLKQALLSDGIPIEKIGLIHSKKSASIASDDKEEASNKQFVLVTHNKIKHNSTCLESYFYYNNEKRDLVIWDESLLAGHSIYLNSEKVRRFIAEAPIGFHHRIKGRPFEQDYLPLIDYLERIENTLKDAENSKEKDFQIIFDSLPDDQNRIINKINFLLGNDCKELIKLIEYINGIEHIRYTKEQNGSIIHFVQTLPPELDSIAVLDASHSLRELTKSDLSIKTIELDCCKKYDNLTFNFFKKSSGKNTIEKEHKKGKDSKLFKELIDIICTIIESYPDEPMVIWSFKEDNSLNIIEGIKNSLKEIYPQLDLEKVNQEGNEIFNFQTYGNELGINSLKHCKHSIFCGLLHLPKASLAMSLKGLSGNLERNVYEDKLLYRTDLSEQAHSFYQAVSRGSSRETIDGNCLTHSVYFFHEHPIKMRELLEDIFPKAQWIRYEAKFLDNTTSLSYQRALEIINVLSSISEEHFLSICGVNSKSTDKISTSQARKHLFSDMKENEWKQTIQEIKEDEFLPWGIEGRSFLKRF